MKLRLTTTTVIVALLLSPALKATAIVAFRTPERVVLAGDSFVLHTDAAGRTSSRRACKVLPAGRWWLLLGGMEQIAGTRRGDVDVTARLRTALSGAVTMREAVASLRRAWEGLRDDAAEMVAAPPGRPVVEGGPLFQAVVGGVEAGVPAIGFFGVTLTTRSPAAFAESSVTCPGNCLSGRVFAGWSRADGPVVDLIREPRPLWLEVAGAAAARRLIEMQIKATPRFVGGPVDVLEITAGGARWVGRDKASACGEVK